MKLLVVGLSFGQNYIQAAQKSNNWEIAGIVARTKESLKNVGDKYGIGPRDRYQDLKMALNGCKELDAVAITTPNKLHFPMAKMVLEHDKHLMLEKPIVETWQQAIELVALLDQKGKKACVGQSLRGDYMIRMMEHFLREGIIGKIETLQFENHWYWTGDPEKEWRFKLPHMFMDDIAIHQIDEIRMLLGNSKAKQIMAASHTPSFYPIKSLFTTASGIWTMEDGAHVNYFGSMGLKGKVEGWYGRVNIFGDKGSMFRESSGQPFVYLDGKKEPIGLDDEYGEDLDELIPLFEFEKIPYIVEDFYHAINGDRAPITDLHDNLNTFAIMLAMKRSSNEHRTILLDDEFPLKT